MKLADILGGMPTTREGFLALARGKTVKDIHEMVFDRQGPINEVMDLMWGLFYAGFARVEHGSNTWYPVTNHHRV